VATGQLDVYLNDHLAGAFAGRALARRAAKRQKAGASGESLARVADDIEHDLASLEQLMQRLGVPSRRRRARIGEVAQAAAQLKLGGLFHRGEPVARLEELETLALGIEGKLALWLALRHGTGNGDETSAELQSELDRLVERARSQREVVEELRLRAAEAVMKS
jgi:hypothetical protein